MALKYLSTGEMVSLTGSWVEKKHPDRRALQSVPPVAMLLPHVDAAHAALLASQRDPELERLAGISAMEGEVDGLHDNQARGIWYGLEAYEYLARDAAQAAQIARLQDMLFPDGLKVVQYSYRETAGQGALLASRMTADQKALLATLPVQGGTMLDEVHAWLEAAARLGALENERTRLAQPLPAGTTMRARNQWIRTIQAVRTVIDLEAPENPLVHRLLQRIADAELAADRRLRGGNGDEKPVDPVDGETPAQDPVDDDLDTAPVDPVDGETPADDVAPVGDDALVAAPVAAVPETSADTLA